MKPPQLGKLGKANDLAHIYTEYEGGNGRKVPEIKVSVSTYLIPSTPVEL